MNQQKSPITSFHEQEDSDDNNKQEKKAHINQFETQSLSLLATDGLLASQLPHHNMSTEQKQQKNKQTNIFWLQLFSMFIFIYSSTCSQGLGVDLAYLVGAVMAIPICAKQTGANLNPAVSYSMTFKSSGNTLSYLSLLWVYVKAQIIGAVLAMIVAVNINDVYRTPLYPQVIINSDISQNNVPYAIIIFRIMLSEAVGIFILIFMILYATGPFSFITNNGAKYVLIAVFIYIGRKFAIMSGNQINLALTLSQAFVGFSNCDFMGFKFYVVWIIGDVIGVLLATSLYNYVVQPTLRYMEVHSTEKIKSKIEVERQIQMSEIKDSKPGDESKRKIIQKTPQPPSKSVNQRLKIQRLQNY